VLQGRADTVKTEKQKRDRLKQKIETMYRLDAIDHKIIEIFQENPLATHKEVAALLDLSKKQIELRMKKPGIRKRLDDMRSSVQQLIQRAQILGVKRLMQLMVSRDEWVALQASKAILAPLLNVGKIQVDQTNRSIVYEVQIGKEGQIYQTARELADPSANPQRLPTVMDAAVQIIDTEASA
jgi:hypothetical protein